jgi:hypothetical protein
MIRDHRAGRRWLLVGLVAAVALALLFGLRAVLFMQDWSGEPDQDIEGWMTPRYLAMSWDVPPDVVATALGIARDGSGRRLTLDEIAEARGVPVSQLAAEVEAAIAAFREGR